MVLQQQRSLAETRYGDYYEWCKMSTTTTRKKQLATKKVLDRSAAWFASVNLKPTTWKRASYSPWAILFCQRLKLTRRLTVESATVTGWWPMGPGDNQHGMLPDGLDDLILFDLSVSYSCQFLLAAKSRLNLWLSDDVIDRLEIFVALPLVVSLNTDVNKKTHQ